MAEQMRAVQLKHCDVVMKGGITSGVVYPPAIVELSREYQFKNIGGTSAGAIAAAATAAAEYGRQRNAGPTAGFERLADLNLYVINRSGFRRYLEYVADRYGELGAKMIKRSAAKVARSAS